MPYRILCGNCGHVFHESTEKFPHPSQIVQEYQQCPKCGKKLVNSENVSFKEVEK